MSDPGSVLSWDIALSQIGLRNRCILVLGRIIASFMSFAQAQTIGRRSTHQRLNRLGMDDGSRSGAEHFSRQAMNNPTLSKYAAITIFDMQP